MWWLISWLVFGLIVGLLSKWLHPGEEPVGFLPTLGIGVAGSFIGGFASWLVGFGTSPLAPAGLIMSVVGGVLFCYIYQAYNSYLESQKPKDE